MPISFEETDDALLLVYEPDGFNTVAWVDGKLEQKGEVTIKRTFTVHAGDLLAVGQEDARRFRIGSIDGQYWRLRAEVLGTKHDVLIDRKVRLNRHFFIAERDISIFWRIDAVSDQEITIGGDAEGAIPAEEFYRLLREFPTSGEMRLYSYSRVTRVLREYMDTMTDAEAKLTRHMERRRAQDTEPSVAEERLPAVTELELEKFEFVRDRVKEMLGEAESYSEEAWQRTLADLFLLIFPQYIAVLQKVPVAEHYSRKPKATTRVMDLVLVDSNGTVDILEIKKPFAKSLMSVRQYRDNHVPLRELSGTVMQIEKYLFYLSKSGPDGERRITDRYKAELPTGLDVQVTNPKAFILYGRDDDFLGQQQFDFEFVRRKYSNVLDIITYDDLLRRLDNIINGLKKRSPAV